MAVFVDDADMPLVFTISRRPCADFISNCMGLRDRLGIAFEIEASVVAFGHSVFQIEIIMRHVEPFRVPNARHNLRFLRPRNLPSRYFP